MKLIRNFAVGLLVLLLILGSMPLYASASFIRVTVDGRILPMDVQPTVIAGRTLVPLRAIFEALGATVQWDETTRRIIGVRGSRTIVLHLGSATALVNGVPVILDVAPQKINGRTMVPTRFVAESLGAGVLWNAVTNTVMITRTQATTTVTARTQPMLILHSEGVTVGAGAQAPGTLVEVSTTIPGGRHFVNWTQGATVISTTPHFIFPMPANTTTLIANFQSEPVRYTIEPAFWYRGRRAKFKVHRPVAFLHTNIAGQVIARTVFAPIAELLAVMGTTANIRGNKATFQYDGRTVSIPLVSRMRIHGDGYDFIADFDGLGYVEMKEFLQLTFPETLPHTPSNPDLVHYIPDVGVSFKLDPQSAHDPVAVYRQLTTIFADIPLSEHRLLRAYERFGEVTPTEFAKIKAMAEEIIAGLTNDYEKFKALSIWTATNIFYDWDPFVSGDLTKLTGSGGQYSMPYAVLKYRVGVCAGYNALLMTMLYAVGIPARAVYSRAVIGHDYNTLHVWTEAFVSGRWVASDATWKSTNRFKAGIFHRGERLTWEWFDFPIERAPGKPQFIRVGTVKVR